MRRFPPRDEPPPRRPRRDLPRSEGPFDRLLRRRPDRDPAPIIIGGTVAFLALVIVLVFVFSSVFGGSGGGGSAGGPGSGSFDVAAGITGKKGQLPGLPPGLVSVSDYVEFEAKQDAPVNIQLELKDTIQDPAGLGFYTFFEGRWQRLAEAKLQGGGKMAEADFTSVPRNLAVLRVIAQTYQVAASLPHDTVLHADAQVSILSPRDYSPGGDGSVQGSATKIPAGGKFLLMPTIVGSSQDTASAVNDILKDDQRRAKHINEITSLVQKGGFDGIDVEYSAVNVDLKDQFTDFIQGLADSLHRGSKRLSITLPPPTNQRLAYDWKKLGEAVDLVKVLPIADPVSYWQTMPGAMGQITGEVDPRKVMLVVSPFSIEADGGGAKPIGFLQAMALAADAAVREPNPADIKSGVTVRLVAKNLDEGEGASPIRWSDDAAALSFALGGNERRRVFIENSFSFAFKLELAQAYGLAGVAVSDASAASDVANPWPTVNELVSSATVTLRRPNDNSLLPLWQAPEGGDLGAGAGTTATWIAPKAGQYNIVLVVSDGERRFGRKTLIEVRQGDEASPSPLVTFPPESTSPTASPSPTGSGSPTSSPGVGPSLEAGLVADGDGDGTFSNQETAPPGGPIKYLATIDNDSAESVTIRSLLDSAYADFECLTESGQNVIGVTLEPDDGDGPNSFNGGPDEVKCTFTEPAPSTSATTVHSFLTALVEDSTGRTASAQDDTSVTTS